LKKDGQTPLDETVKKLFTTPSGLGRLTAARRNITRDRQYQLNSFLQNHQLWITQKGLFGWILL
jgi:hypothetical protein